MPETPAESWPPGSFLDRLGSVVAAELLEHGRTRQFAAREMLILQGSGERHVLLLQSGVVVVSVSDESGERSVLALRRRGDVVGELAAVTGEPRSASVQAVVPTVARALPGPVFSKFLAKRPGAARELIRIQAHRLHWANGQRAEFARLDARARLARTLIDLAAVFRQGSGSPTIALSQSELASLVGVRIGTAESALRELQNLGAIVRRYRAVSVVDERRLQDAARPQPGSS